MRAAARGLVESMKVLIEYGGDVHYTTEDGQSVLDKVNTCTDIVKWERALKFLMDELAKPRVQILNKQTLLKESVTNFVLQLKEQDQLEAFKFECGLQEKKEVVSDGNLLSYIR